MMSLTKNFEIVNKISYIFRLFEQERQGSNTTTVSVINNKIEKNLNIIIKKFKCYNCDKTDYKAFACFNEHISDQNFQIESFERRKTRKKSKVVRTWTIQRFKNFVFKWRRWRRAEWKIN